MNNILILVLISYCLPNFQEADSLFQSEDFDEDGNSECIGLTVSEITIFKSEESSVNLLTGKYSVPEDFLKRFSR